MIEKIVIATYILRKKTSDRSEDWLSNAIFYSSVSLMLAIGISVNFMLSLFGMDHSFNSVNEKIGFDIELLIAVLFFLLIWGALKFRFKSKTNSEIEDKIKTSRLLRESPALVALAPLILVFILLMLSLFVL